MEHTLSWWVILVCYRWVCCEFAQANTEGVVFLERGRRGIVPSPPITLGLVTLEETDAVYWYYRQRDRGSLLISYFKGNVAHQNGIPEGVYDIDSEFSLVIENVTASNEGFYLFVVKPRMKKAKDGFVEVYEKVSPSRPFPIITGCDRRQFLPDHVQIEKDTLMRSLTCEVDYAKPAVELSWYCVFVDGSEEPVDASQTVRTVVLPPNKGSALRNHTFTTSSSIQLTSVNDDVKYRCEAHGVAVGNGSHMTVSFAKAHSTSATVTHSEPNRTENAGTAAAPTTNEASVLTSPATIVLAVILLVFVIMTVFYVASRRTNRHKDKNSTTFKRVPTIQMDGFNSAKSLHLSKQKHIKVNLE